MSKSAARSRESARKQIWKLEVYLLRSRLAVSMVYRGGLQEPDGRFEQSTEESTVGPYHAGCGTNAAYSNHPMPEKCLRSGVKPGCGGAGAPCPDCNKTNPADPDDVPAMPAGASSKGKPMSAQAWRSKDELGSAVNFCCSGDGWPMLRYRCSPG
jgi:hypothetical protein